MPLIDMSETYQMTNVGDHIDGTDVYQSNRNLLDNAYFVGGGSQLGDGVFPINQRGQTTYQTAAWNMDRWYGACTLYADHIHIPEFIQQNASYPLNTPLTMSVMLADGTILSGTNTFTETSTQQYFYTDGSNIQLVRAVGGRLMIWTGVGVDVKAVKLEVGTVSTLANDPVPDFGEELRKCQRYFVRLKGTNYWVLNGFASATNYADFSMPLGLHPFAKTPTITTSGTHTVRNGTTNYTVSSMAAQVNTDNILTGIRMTVSSSTMTAYTLAVYGSDGNSYIDLSAEL